MPAWKKVIVSGSDASLNSINVATNVVAQSFTGSLFGTASWANNTITALTASYVNPLRQNVILTGSLLVTQSYISTVDYIDFTLTANPAHNEGRIHWIDDTKTLNVDTDVNNFYIEVGHQNVVRVNNQNPFTLTKGTIVYINGENGQRPTVATASWTDDSLSATTLGFVAQDINNGQNGYVVTRGIIRDINTNAYSPGTMLFLSASGQYTSTVPVAPLHQVRLGRTITQATAGTIYVDIMNGYEIGELHDVLETNRQNGDLIVFDSGSRVYKNSKILSGSYGVSGSLNISEGITGSLLGTSSYSTQALSSSFASTASYVNPLRQDVLITGSLNVSGSGKFYKSSTDYVDLLTEANSISFSPNAASYIKYGSTIILAMKSGGGNSTVMYGAGTSILSATQYGVKIGRNVDGANSTSMLEVRGSGSSATSTTVKILNSNNSASFVITDDGSSRLGFEYSDTHIITGSVSINGSLSISSSIFQYSDNTDVDTGTETVMTIATGSYRCAFFDYVVTKTTNARAGTVMAVWSGSSIQFTEASTNDIGTTTDLILTPVLSGANVLLQARTLSDNWSVKTLARLI